MNSSKLGDHYVFWPKTTRDVHHFHSFIFKLKVSFVLGPDRLNPGIMRPNGVTLGQIVQTL